MAPTNPNTPTQPIPASLSHFVIFNPTIKPPLQATSNEDAEDRDKDLEDDLREAAQILFYTSREAGGVSRDKMLRQVGLAKGLMGFADMVDKDDSEVPGFYSIHSHRSRLLLYSPEPDFYIYLSITLAHGGNSTTTPASPSPVGSSKSKHIGEPTLTAQGLSDRLLVEALRRGYSDFRLLHSPLSNLLPPTPALSTLLDKFWTRSAFSFESTHLSGLDPLVELTTWIGGYPPVSLKISTPIFDACNEFRRLDDDNIAEFDIGVITQSGPVTFTGQTDEAMLRFLLNQLQLSLPPILATSAEQPTSKVIDGRQSLGLGFGRRKKTEEGSRKSSWATFGSAAVGWVPGLGGGSDTSHGSSSPVPTAIPVTGSSDTGGTANGSAEAASSPRKRSGWSNLGLGSLGDAVGLGHVGAALGLSGSSKSDTAVKITEDPSSLRQQDFMISDTTVSSTNTTDLAQVSNAMILNGSPLREDPASPQDSEPQDGKITSEPINDDASPVRTSIEQNREVLSELEDAQGMEDQVEVGWEGRWVWLRSEEDGERWMKRRLYWVIRDTILLYILHPANFAKPYDSPASSSKTLELLSKITLILSSSIISEPTHNGPKEIPRPSTPSIGISSTISHTTKEGIGETEIKGPIIDSASAASLGHLRDTVQSDPNIVEVFAKTSSSQFVVVKRTPQLKPKSEIQSSSTSVISTEPAEIGISSLEIGPSIGMVGVDLRRSRESSSELYMLVGRKDASLTDADHAVRSFARLHPEFAN